MPVAIAALAGMVRLRLDVGRRVVRAGEFDWRAVLFVWQWSFALWILALSASPVAVAAVPAIYPLVFATLTLRPPW